MAAATARSRQVFDHGLEGGLACCVSEPSALLRGSFVPREWADPIPDLWLPFPEGLAMNDLGHRFTAAALLTILVPLVAATSTSSASIRSDAAPAAAPPVVELLSRGTVAEPFEAEAHGIELEAERPIDVAVAHLTFAPGASTGWHRHPGPTVVTVTTGELTVTSRHCKQHTYGAGETFVEEGPRRHIAVNTADSTTETIVTFFVPTGAPALTIPASAPRCAR
jgi:quercetin dioxygenase-like cupin family protein